jgi:ATP-dependent phosphoenolpyruvate carboxykinase
MLFITQRKSNSLSILTSSVAELYEYAMLPEHMESPDPTVGPSSITETGALMCSSGSKTGRVPKDKRIVLDGETKDVSI